MGMQQRHEDAVHWAEDLGQEKSTTIRALDLFEQANELYMRGLQELGVQDPSEAALLATRRSAVIPEGTQPELIDRLAPATRKLLNDAEDEARGLGHDYVGTEHLVLAFLHEDSPVRNIIIDPTTGEPADLDKARAEVIRILDKKDKRYEGEIGLSPRMIVVIQHSVDKARRLGLGNPLNITPEALVLGFVEEGSGIGAQLMEALGISLEKTERRAFQQHYPQSNNL